ncbi:ArsR/SmtB family transcription factor [Ensifer sp. NPDC090286]|uniref:ArsR/SmtB family transcription factor n=1 Tax=Ensifer sp. NPDC090286 TaxID=3363991 RepID=UPI003839F224
MSVGIHGSLETLAEKAQEAAEFVRHFSNANRLMLLCHIAQQESSVGEIQEALGIKQPALSQQLAELRQAGLVKTRRESRQIYYTISDGRAEAVMKLLFKLFCDPKADLGDQRAVGSPDATTPIRMDAAHFARVEPVGPPGQG